MAILCVASLVVLIDRSKTEVDLPFGLGQKVSAHAFALVVSLLIVATYIGYASCHVQAVRVREVAQQIIDGLDRPESKQQPTARQWCDFLHTPGTMRVSPLAANLGRGAKATSWVLKVVAFAAHDLFAVVVVTMLAARLYGDLSFAAFILLTLVHAIFLFCFVRCALAQFSAAQKAGSTVALDAAPAKNTDLTSA